MCIIMIISLPSTNELSRYTQECKCPCLDTARNRFPMNGLHSHKPPSDKLPTLSPSCFLILFQPFTQKIRFNTITLKKKHEGCERLKGVHKTQSHKPFTPPISVCGSDVHNHMRAIRRHKPACLPLARYFTSSK